MLVGEGAFGNHPDQPVQALDRRDSYSLKYLLILLPLISLYNAVVSL